MLVVFRAMKNDAIRAGHPGSMSQVAEVHGGTPELAGACPSPTSFCS